MGAREGGDAVGPGLGRSFSPLSPWVSAWENVMKPFLPLCHRAPPSFFFLDGRAAEAFARDLDRGAKAQLFWVSDCLSASSGGSGEGSRTLIYPPHPF